MNEKTDKNVQAMQLNISGYYKQPAKEDLAKQNYLRK